jgi:Domain of unknown function (DUF1854)
MKPGDRLHRSAFGRLAFTSAAGETSEPVVPVRAFPIAAPGEGIAIVSPEGHELAWIDRLEAIDAAARALIEEELATREFMPEIVRITAVSSYVTPSTFSVQTDRGATKFVLDGEEFIRRLGGTTLLIADSHGIHYLIRDLRSLDATTRRILDRFL